MPSKPFTFICGDDDYLVSERAKAWFAERTEGLSDDLSKEIIEGRAANVAEVEAAMRTFSSAVQTVSLFGDRKVVWFREISFIADNPTGRAESTLELLENLRAVLETVDPENVSVLLSASPVDRRRSFFKWAQKAADSVVLTSGKDGAQAYAGLIKEACDEAGVSISPDAISILIGKVGGNTRLIVEETRKLATFIGSSGETIDERMVMDLVPNFGEADFFEAADAFFSLQLDWTLEALRRHFFNNSESRPLLGSLQSRNRLLIQLRVLLDAGAIRLGGRGISKGALEAAAATYARHFGEAGDKTNLNVFTQNPWYLGRLAESAAKIPLKKLMDFQVAFAEAFEGIMERPNEQEEVLREVAVKCLS